MAHRTRQRANLAAWAPNSAVLGTEFDAFDAGVAASIDGDAGGLWSPAAPIVIGGAGLDTVGPRRALGTSDFSAPMQAQNWPERYSIASAATINTDTPIAWSSGLVGFGLGPIFCVMPQNQFQVTSDDGSLWTTGSGYGGVMTGSAKDVAVGIVGGSSALLATDQSTGTLIKSLNGGVTWTQIGLSTVPTASVLAWSSSLGLWVAAGNAGVLRTSPDGTTWTARTTPAGWIAGCGGTKRIVWNGSLFVILPLGSYNKVLTSSDGITWTERTLTATGIWTGVAYGSYDGYWLAVTSGGVVNKSADGLTWAAVATSLGGVNDLAVNGVLWVAPTVNGLAGGIAWSVDLGITWRTVAVGNHRVATSGYQRVIFADNRFIAVHANGSALEFALSLRSS